tara:strand:- start:662 stop:889 length:228 start_codon:yes stop_codon:yes gene_type:complete
MKIYFNEATKLLKDQNNVLVRFEYWNGIIRSKHGEEKGELSTKMVDKLIDKNKLEFICDGSGLLNHEKYYKIAQS